MSLSSTLEFEPIAVAARRFSELLRNDCTERLAESWRPRHGLVRPPVHRSNGTDVVVVRQLESGDCGLVRGDLIEAGISCQPERFPGLVERAEAEVAAALNIDRRKRRWHPAARSGISQIVDDVHVQGALLMRRR